MQLDCDRSLTGQPPQECDAGRHHPNMQAKEQPFDPHYKHQARYWCHDIQIHLCSKHLEDAHDHGRDTVLTMHANEPEQQQ